MPTKRSGNAARHATTERSLHWIAMVLALAGALAACGSPNAETSATGTAVPTTELPTATTSAPTQSDISAIQAAFVSYWSLPTTCPVVLSGTLQLAYDAAGTGWAVGLMVPGPTCAIYREPLANERPGPGPNGGYSVSPMGIEAFGTNQKSVFSRLPGYGWLMDGLAGFPFPCPAPQGEAPGPTNGALPSAVVKAFGLTYATNCVSVYFAPGPRN